MASGHIFKHEPESVISALKILGRFFRQGQISSPRHTRPLPRQNFTLNGMGKALQGQALQASAHFGALFIFFVAFVAFRQFTLSLTPLQGKRRRGLFSPIRSPPAASPPLHSLPHAGVLDPGFNNCPYAGDPQCPSHLARYPAASVSWTAPPGHRPGAPANPSTLPVNQLLIYQSIQ